MLTPHTPGWIGVLVACVALFALSQQAQSRENVANLREVSVAGASRTVQAMAAWAIRSGDSENLPFLIVDKVAARIFVFDARGALRGSSQVLLGLARGDHSVPGIGERPIANLKPHERTTAAGRFVGEPGRNLAGEDIIWIDYDAALSIHRVRAGPPHERRLERLNSRTVADNRISYGCVNVPRQFYEKTISPAFAGGRGIVYVLPETKSVAEVFGFLFDH